MKADLKEIDRKWAEKWDEDKIFEADPIDGREKIFVTFPFPYMNGPLHLGHTFTSTRIDVWARFKRMQGYNTLFPWSWHITGEPITGAAERVKKGDQSQIKIFKEVDEVPESELEKFIDPEYIAKYYIAESKISLKELGHSIDWRREFHTSSLHPQFNRFIEWQYLTLRDKGYVIKGTHPVVYCPHDESPTGDHDRLKGEGASPMEFIVLKFDFEGAFLPAATLRPETIFGVTNMWINPDAVHSRIEVDGQQLIVSLEAVQKIMEQKDGVKVLETDIKGSAMIGKYCTHPLNGNKIPILPATFVNPDHATGIVMSVPSHAPYDWVALKDIQNNPESVSGYGITKEQLERIKPISLIETKAFGDHSAIEICEEMGIKDQLDPKLEEATEKIYKEEFYKGALKPIAGKFSGKMVNEVKKELVEEFESKGIIDKIYEITEEVICRCGNKCLVKILKDQWFLKYSDEEWKEQVRNALKDIKILPEDARSNFENTIDWLEDKACARKSGLGTPIPWNPEWIVETLSDSTIYMSFYTIAKHLSENNIPGENLNREVFDFIFFNKGSAEKIATENSIDEKLLQEMQGEFNYWMPVDLRSSAKELIPNHLTFFIFQHVALFPKDKWPRRIGANGMMSIEGEKMSKSKGNFITLKKALRDFGASVIRAGLLYASEGMRDPDWKKKTATDTQGRLEGLLDLSDLIINLKESREEIRSIDRWIISRMQGHIKGATDSMEEFKTRMAFQAGFFDVWKDIKWYMRRDTPNKEVLIGVLEDWIKLLAPYTPALSEEIWQKMGKTGYISMGRWPELDDSKVSKDSEVAEEIISTTTDDVDNILKVTGITPKRIILYTSPSWKYKALEIVSSLDRDKLKGAIGHVMKNEELRRYGKEVPKFVGDLTKDPSRINYYGEIDEKSALSESLGFLEKEYNCKVEIFQVDDSNIIDPMKKSRQAAPYKPAIFIE